MLSARDSSVVMDLAKGVRDGIEAMTPAAKHVYELAVRQAFIHSLTTLIVMAAGLYLWWGILLPMTRKHARESTAFDADVGAHVVTTVGCIIIIIVLITLPHVISQLLNPEWAAIKNIASALNK